VFESCPPPFATTQRRYALLAIRNACADTPELDVDGLIATYGAGQQREHKQ